MGTENRVAMLFDQVRAALLFGLTVWAPQLLPPVFGAAAPALPALLFPARDFPSHPPTGPTCPAAADHPLQAFWPEDTHCLRPLTGRYTYSNLHALGVPNVLCACVQPEVRAGGKSGQLDMQAVGRSSKGGCWLAGLERRCHATAAYAPDPAALPLNQCPYWCLLLLPACRQPRRLRQ